MGKTSSSYMPGDSDVGSYLRVLAGYTDGHGIDETITSDATSLIRNVNDAPEGSVLVSGYPIEDEVLSVDASSLSDVDGMGEITLQWQSQDALGAWSDIIGANGSSTILLGDEEVGKTLRAQASYTDGYGTLEVISSSSTQTIENINDTPEGLPYIEGILSQGETLTANVSGIRDADGIPDLSNGAFEIDPFSYVWQSSVDGSIWKHFDGYEHHDENCGCTYNVTEKTLHLTEAEVGKQIRVLVSYTDTYGTTETVVSEVSSAVTNVNDAPTGSILLEGSFVEDEVLTVITSNLEDNDGLGDLNYQWQRSGDGDDWNMIIGADEDSYTLDDDDVGQQVRAVISYTDGGNTPESVVSSVSDVISNVNDTPEGSVIITGTLSQGQTLFADTHGLKDADGIGTFSYQWQRTEDGNHFVDIPAANSETYLLTDERCGNENTCSG